MLREIQEPLERLETAWAELEALTGELTQEQIEFRPGEGWSIHLVVDHVEKAEVGFFGMMDRSEGRGRRRRPWYRTLVLKIVHVILTRGIRVKMPSGAEESQPTSDRSLPELFESARAARARSAELFGSLTPSDLDRSAAKHPVGGALDFREALWFVEAHFRHHGRQIERIRSHPSFPTRSP